MDGVPLDFKRDFKAGFFASLFNDRERGLELVNALMDGSYPPGTDVEIETLTDVFFMGIQNDLALLVGNTVLFLGEHQSSVNKTITVRFISYYGRILEGMVSRKQTYRQGTLKLARPVFVVLYNGIDPYPARSVLKLSRSYKEPAAQLEIDSFIELQAVVVNIHAPENEELIRKSPHLFGYVEVVRRGRDYHAQGMSVQDSVRKAIQECIDEGIIADYLRRHASEVIGMLTEQFNLDDALSARHADGKDEGIQIGEERSRRTLRALRDSGIDIKLIINASGLTEEEIKRL
ncbi:MAG: hypothetical protein LBH66_07105 [Oscillospiraceae bacterium]|jgi:hypothetical protein|nr:hypothetical protein [Oscillospiraceae bacterium]